ncbi:MAG: glutamine--tRNA ligase/YqeY domain fusion protein [Acidimicrobiia bacterium]|nr:glutamine--tRNA ligase/YqeY domain fusion protein [Acidimicrobiia bacterium]MYC57959.1 glutamine--tRNA ligase/YqeY domain fusion protein [Acidimicrobiia bacterium]MYG94647.1 glutamine--tRNA ligase/YqeY domain fusion protein [Acidimicrobiia bacterium]MYI31092.1 glutamine--tRNA ligase/YqeY domain fusion protein [Acidimicrobiia bacterium]
MGFADSRGLSRPSERSDFIRSLVRQEIADGTFAKRVQTRFPPEPNGYLHIGHAKSICLNFDLAAEFGGICNLRLDDTNPETERAHFAAAIEEDIAWLGYESHSGTLYASDYFGQLYEWAEQLINAGLAYVDDQDAATISKNRGSFSEPGISSPFRDRSVAENLTLFRQMAAGDFAAGERVLRARIDMAHENMLMRDPVLYRIRHYDHHRTGTKWCVYPTYDWAHGQSDAIEGVTNSICTLEFDAHRPLYDWFLDHLDLPGDRPRQTEFARLNITHTVLSKRLLMQLVDEGHVEGWDDPRMPTLRGLRRRGFPPSAIKDFCRHVGVARVDGTVEVELLESFVRRELNRTSLRRMAVLNPLPLLIENYPSGQVEMREAVNNPEDPFAGTRQVPFDGELFIERDDFMLEPPSKFYRLAPGREVRLRSGYFVTCTGVDTAADGTIARVRCSYDPDTGSGQAPDGRRPKATLHWVSAKHAIDGQVVLYERLFADSHPGADGADPMDSFNPASVQHLENAKFEAAMADIAPGQVVQFERLGYFAHDPITTNFFHRTVGLRDEWARIQKRRG